MIRHRRSPQRAAVLVMALVVLGSSLAPLSAVAADGPVAVTAAEVASPAPSPVPREASPAPEPTPVPTPEPTPVPTPEPGPSIDHVPAADPGASPADPGASPDPGTSPDPDTSADPGTSPVPSPSAAATPTPADPASGDPASGGAASPAPADSPSPAPAATPAAATAGPARTVPYLVSFASAAAFAARSELFARLGTAETRALPALRLASVDLPADGAAALVLALRSEPGVRLVEPDRLRSVDAGPGDPRVGDQWALGAIGWPHLHDGDAPGGHVVVAILDTGVDATHPDLEGQVLPGTSFIDGVRPGLDANGHGTAMAGIVAATTDNGIGVAGVGFAGVSILPVTVMDTGGAGRDSDIVAGVVYAVDSGADVILMAFSSRSDSSALRAAMDYAWSRGVVVVAAAGNDASDAVTYPAGDPGVVGVAATGRDDQLLPDSNHGPAVAMAAPGGDILTTIPGGTYETVSGSSAAAAHVAAAAALLRSREPSLANDVIVGRLLRTAVPMDTAAGAGAGRLDLAAAWDDASSGATQPGGGDPGPGAPGDPYLVAATCTSQGGGGNWNQAATWSCGRVPGSTTAADTVVVVSGSPVTVTANTGTTNTTAVTVNAGATLTINAGRTLTVTAAPASITVNGTLVVTGTLNASGAISVNAGGIYRHNRNGGAIPVATWDPASTLEVTGWTNATDNPPVGFDQALGNVTWNSTGQTAALSFAGTMTTIRGNLTILSTGSASMAFGGTGVGDTTIGGNLVVGGGILRGNYSQAAGAARKIMVQGAVSLTGGTLDLNGSDSATVTLNIAGDFSVTGGTLSRSGGAPSGVNFTGTAVQTYTSGATLTGAIAFTVASGATLQMAAATTTVGGTGTFTLAAGATLGITSPAGITATGAAGNVQVTGARSYSTAANYTYNGTGAQAPGNGLPATVNTLTVAKPSGTLALAASVTVNGNLAITGGTLDLGAFSANRGAAGGTLTVANGAALRIAGTGTLPVGFATHAIGATSTVEYAGTGAVAALNSGQRYGQLLVSGTVTSGTADVGVATSLVVASGATFSPAGGTTTMGNGSTISNSGTLAFRGLSIAPAATVTTAASFTVKGALVVGAGGVLAPTAGVVTFTDGASIVNSGSLTFAGMAVAAGAGATGSGDVTVTGTMTVNAGGTYTPAPAQVIGGAGTLTGAGTVRVTRVAATAGFANQYPIANPTLAGLTVEYAGSAAQVISALAYGGLRMNNPAGATLAAGVTTVGGTLTLTAGVITTGASNLFIATGGSVIRTSGHIAGNLRKAVATGAPTVTFEIGDATAYTPVTVAFASVTAAGDLTASTTAGEHAAIASAPIDGAQDANRSWTLDAGLTFTTASATFTFVAGDLDAGADTGAFRVGRYAAASWSATATGSRTATTTTATGLTALGQFAVGEPRGLGIFTDDADLGGPALIGYGYESAGTYTVQGAGTDISGTADQLHLISRALAGDAVVTARVTALGNTDPSARAGVMIRETTAAGSRHAFVGVTPGSGAAFGWRATTGGASGITSVAGPVAPSWVRLVRVGDTFTAYRSPDGTTWTQLGATQTISMGGSVLVGLAVTSHDPAALTTATFDSVTIRTPPAAAADAWSMAQDNTLVVAAPGVLANDTVTVGALSVATPRPMAGPANGTLALASDGSFTYQPAAGFTGTDTFTYRATDGSGLASTPVTVTITVASTAYISDAGWGTAFDGARHLDLTYPPYVPAGSVIGSATFRHTYRSLAGGTTCAYIEVYIGATLIGTHGSAASPISCATTAFVTDTIALPEISDATRANTVTVRIYLRNSAGGRSEHRVAGLDLDYSLR